MRKKKFVRKALIQLVVIIPTALPHLFVTYGPKLVRKTLIKDADEISTALPVFVIATQIFVSQ